MSSNESSSDEDRISVRGEDGEWVDLALSERIQSDDLELDELWAMSIDELQIILDDEEHRLYEKAKQVSAEAFAPLLKALRTLVLPKIDLGALVPKIDLSWLAPKFNLYPKIDLSGFTKSFQLNFGPSFTAVLERYRASRPANWPTDINLSHIITVIQDDGLPLVWIPRAEIVSMVLSASDRQARVRVLLDHSNELFEDCREVLDGISHASLNGQLPLARKALEALEAGYGEAAQALAVVVTETAVARGLGGRYADVKKQVLFDPDLVHYTELRLRAALAPIGPFYTTWYASSGMPAPEGLSRHVAVHQADKDHYTPGNAVVAVLLATSVLRALQELQELAESTEQ